MRETVTTIKCDLCHKAIESDDVYIDAEVYGFDFHPDCVEACNGTLIGFLVDDIKIGRVGCEPRELERYYWDKK